MPGDYLALRLQTNRIMGSLGTHDNGSRFPGKSNPSHVPFFLIWIAQGSVEEEDTTKSKTAKGECKDN